MLLNLPYIIRKIIISASFVFLVSILCYPQQDWVLTNGPYGGESVYDIIQDSQGSIYIGTASGGVYKSTDNGTTWVKKNSGMGNRFIKAFAFQQDSAILVATSPWSDGRIFRSTDHGESWDQIFSAYNGINCLSVAPTGWIYAGTWGSGIFMSTNQGASWGQYNVGLLHLRINAIYFKDGYVFANTDGGGVHRSTNGGLEWEPVNNGLPVTSEGWIFAKPYAIKSNGEIFINTEVPNLQMYKTTNNGDNWTFISTVGVNRMMFTNNNILYASFWNYQNGGGLKRSFDDGKTWSNFGLQGLTTFSFLLDSNYVMYGGTLSHGLYKRDENGVWTQLFNQGSVRVRTNMLKKTDLYDSLIFAGTDDWGLFYTSDFGDKWIQTGLKYEQVSNIAFAHNNFIYAGGSNVYLSTDGGETFEMILNQWIRSIYIDKHDQVYVGTYENGFLKSTDHGATWQSWAYFGDDSNVDDMMQTGDSTFIAGFYIFWHDPSGNHYSYYTVITTDNGNSWQNVSNNFELRCFLMSNSGRIYAYTKNKVYTSTDKGFTWTQMDMHGLNTYDIDGIDLNSNDVFFVGLYNKIIKTSDLGETWIEIPNNNLESHFIDDILTYKDTLLFFCNSDGIYKRDQDILTNLFEENTNVECFSISQNYPNPFNPSTKIKYTIAPPNLPEGEAFVTLKVYDVLGREVATLVNEEKPPGSYEVEFNGGNLPSGVYFYRIKVGSFIKTRKMVLLK